ncbi:MAG: T9SS C-terminal target domain-containing protein [Cytophagales bacterium]|nr:MAG: T9SS C-terminal target domain-containing protein [Cytophagales bacterium]
MKKYLYIWILLLCSIPTYSFSQRIRNTDDVTKVGPPKPDNISSVECIGEENTLPKGPCCDVKVPFRYNPGAGDRLNLETPLVYDPNANNGYGGWVQGPPTYIYTGSWDFATKTISTDPAKPYNPEQSWVNKFDWKKTPLKGWFPNYGGTWGGATPLFLTNPYFDDLQESISYFSSYRPGSAGMDEKKMDFHPEDGWELLHRHFGYQPDEVTLQSSAYDSRHYPYYMLYNRYTGKLRQIATLPYLPGQQLFMKLRHSDGLNKASGLLNAYNGGVIRALDQKTYGNVVKSPSKPADDDRSWVAGDFDMMYDPCVCNHESQLFFEYEKIETANLYLEGRIIGTNVPLNGSGKINETLLNGKDFLWAVNKPDFGGVKGGMQTYFNIDKLVTQYKEPPKLDKSFGELLRDGFKGLLQTGIGAVVGGVDSWLGKKADVFLRYLMPKKNVYTSKCVTEEDRCGAFGVGGIRTTTDTTRVPIFNSEDIKSKGSALGLAGLGTRFLNTQLFPDDTQARPVILNISFLEAEGVFKGTATTTTAYNSNSIRLSTPGSLNSNLSTNSWNWNKYPFYNEALGVFAVLNTPKIDTEVEKIGYQGSNVNRYKFSFKDILRYKFNPAAEIDEKKTTISAALVVRIPKGDHRNQPGEIDPNGFMDNLMLTSEGLHDGATEYVYQTPFFPLSCMSKQIAYLPVFDTDGRPIKPIVELKLMIKTVTQPVRYSKINYGLQIFTYYTEPKSVPYQSLVGNRGSYAIAGQYGADGSWYINDYLLSANWNLIANQIILVKNALITENLTGGKPTTLTAREIDLLPMVSNVSDIGENPSMGEIGGGGASSEIKPSIDIQYNTDIFTKTDECVGLANTTSVDDVYLKNFCRGTQYKANEVEQKYAQEAREQKADMGEKEMKILSIYPNPASTHVKFSYDLEEQGLVNLVIKNINGDTVLSIFSNDRQESGKHEIEVETRSLTNGLYFCTLAYNGRTEIQKLMIVK